MATVPRLDAGQVNPTGLPGFRQSDHGASAEAFGAGAGRALMGVAKQVDAFAEQRRETDETAALLEFQTRRYESKKRLLLDPDTGALNKQGMEAGEATRQAAVDLDTEAQTDLGGMSGRLRLRASALYQSDRESTETRLLAHATAEKEKVQVATAKLAASTAMENVGLNLSTPGNEHLVPDALATILAATKAAYPGMPDRVINDTARRTLSRGIALGLEGARAAPGGTLSAYDLYQKYSAMKIDGVSIMTLEDRAEFHSRIKHEVESEREDADFDGLLNGDPVEPGLPRGPLSEIAPGEALKAIPLADRYQMTADNPLINAYARWVEDHQGLPAGVLLAVKDFGENSGNTHRNRNQAVSPAGAAGLMQFMPQTARNLGLRDTRDPMASLDAAGVHLRDDFIRLRKQGKSEEMAIRGAIAGYNGGGDDRDNVASGGKGVHPEAIKYVPRVMKGWRGDRAMGGVGDETSSQVVSVSAKGEISEPRAAGRPAENVEEFMARVDHTRGSGYVRRMQARAAAHFNDIRINKNNADAAAETEIWEAVHLADPRVDLATVFKRKPELLDYIKRNGMEPKIIDQRTELMATKVRTTDPATKEMLQDLMTEDAEKFAKTSIPQYKHQLSSADFQGFVAAQQTWLAAKDAKAKAAVVYDWSSKGARVAQGARMIVPPGMEKNDARKLGVAYSEFFDIALQEMMEAPGRKPGKATPKELDEIRDSSVRVFLARPDFGVAVSSLLASRGGRPIRGFQGGMVTISPADRQAAIQVIRGAGLVATEELIIRTVEDHPTKGTGGDW